MDPRAPGGLRLVQGQLDQRATRDQPARICPITMPDSCAVTGCRARHRHRSYRDATAPSRVRYPARTFAPRRILRRRPLRRVPPARCAPDPLLSGLGRARTAPPATVACFARRPSGVAASDPAAYPTSRGRHRVEHRAGPSILPNVHHVRPLDLRIYAHFLQGHWLVYAEVGGQ
jgi:hypothetical protein